MVSATLNNLHHIKIATEFSDTPLGRYLTDSNVSGERFRDEFLVPALRAEQQVVVDIDDTEGYGSSFLDEAFGGLVRKGYFTAAALHEKLTIECTDPDFSIYERLIWRYIDEARRQAA